MNEQGVLAERFEAHRARLRAVAYQTLGSASEADDAVREAWLRLSRSDPGTIDNLGGWLTTAVGSVCRMTSSAGPMESASSASAWGPVPPASLTADSGSCIPTGCSRREASMFRLTRATVVSHPPRLPMVPGSVRLSRSHAS